jgi:murein DD-endopeptidase MepM/ murein hydrolase activator NlpD
VDTRLLLAWLHLLALAAGLAGLWSRARALRHAFGDLEDAGALRRALAGDAWWLVAAALWIVTGLWRLLGGTDRSTSSYFADDAFYLKMALVLAIAALEVWPAKTLFRWRMKRVLPDRRDAGRIEAISYVQCALVLVTVAAAASMARGDLPSTPATAAAVGPSAPAAPNELSHDAPPLEPSGVETVTEQDLALLTREIAMPLDGVDPASLRSNFDERRGGGTRLHRALDIMAPRRTVIRSAAKGRVLKLFTSTAGGLMIYAADSAERFILMYAHLDDYAPGLRDGARLARGQPIGYVGSTGNASASAPHLHFAIARSADVKRWSKGKAIDPLLVLQAGAKGAAAGGGTFSKR